MKMSGTEELLESNESLCMSDEEKMSVGNGIGLSWHLMGMWSWL